MSRTYLILQNDHWQANDSKSNDMSIPLQDTGLRLRLTLRGTRIYASDETTTFALPGGGMVIGELYPRIGTVPELRKQLANLPSSTEVRRHIVRECWGDYVAVLPGSCDSDVVSITRSPSHACDLQCLYAQRHGAAFVTSDISIAIRLGVYERRVDYDYIAHRLIFPDLKTCRTGLAGINELLPGSTLELRIGSVSVSQDWSPWDFVGPNIRYVDRHDAANAIRAAITSVVGTWANQDESVLLELSGGLDSSIVGASLKCSDARVACGTLTTSAPGGNETEYARLVANLLAIELAEVELGFAGAAFEFPLPPQLVTPLLGPLQHVVDTAMEAMAEHAGAKSYFSGAGGDTVFCYLPNAAPAADAFRAGGLSTGLAAIHDISTFHQCTYWKGARLTLRKLVRSKGPQVRADRFLLSPRAMSPELDEHPWLNHPDDALAGDQQRIFELSSTQFFQDSCPRGLARRVRMPLLSQPVIEACLRAPSWMWFAGGQNRSIVRDAFSDILPPTILARKSKGTFSGYLGALYRRKKDGMLDFLLDGELQAHGLLDPDALRSFCAQDLSGADSPFMRVFHLCAIENWLRQQAAFAEHPPTARPHRRV